jgi:hypothetical protein
MDFELQRFNTYGVENKKFFNVHNFNEKVNVNTIPSGLNLWCAGHVVKLKGALLKKRQVLREP